jgi:hypothetical protein
MKRRQKVRYNNVHPAVVLSRSWTSSAPEKSCGEFFVVRNAGSLCGLQSILCVGDGNFIYQRQNRKIVAIKNRVAYLMQLFFIG